LNEGKVVGGELSSFRCAFFSVSKHRAMPIWRRQARAMNQAFLITSRAFEQQLGATKAK